MRIVTKNTLTVDRLQTSFAVATSNLEKGNPATPPCNTDMRQSRSDHGMVRGIRPLIALDSLRDCFDEHRSQLQCRPRHAPAHSPGEGPGRVAGLSRARHVDHGNEPPLQG